MVGGVLLKHRSGTSTDVNTDPLFFLQGVEYSTLFGLIIFFCQ